MIPPNVPGSPVRGRVFWDERNNSGEALVPMGHEGVDFSGGPTEKGSKVMSDDIMNHPL